MAETYTSNLGLTKPDYDSPADISVINSNMDKIDSAVANAGKVKSVNGKTGDVALAAADVGALGKNETAANAKQLNGKDASEYTLKSEFNALVSGVEIVPTVSGSVIALNDASNLPLRGLILHGKTTQDGTPTPDNPVELATAGSGGSITVIVSDGENQKNLILSTPDGLPGIPVTSDGNYTDASGQQWICDEIDLERGIRIQRVISLGIDDFFVKTSGDPKWFNSETADSYETSSLYILGERSIGLCNVLKSYPFGEFYGKGIVDGVMNGQSYLVVNFAKSRGVDSVDRFKAWCAEVGFTVQKTLANPIETVLSAAELTSYRALVTNKPNTTIYSDAGDDMTVRYVADTQLYIDKQIGASAAAVNALMEGLTDE